MQRALELAENGRFRTTPNPLVGAVIVNDGRIVGEGYHRRAGADHAEIAALKNTNGRVAGSTLYVTLEPCCHTGRTGPCVESILRAGIKKVVFAAVDPDRRVNGRGARKLRQAGVMVESGIGREKAVKMNEAYFWYHKNRRPFVILKSAQTLDGRIASTTGDSKWISGLESRKYSHRLRAMTDGIVVGMETVRKDDPALTVRHVKGRNPYRIVISSSLRFPKRCQFLDNNTDFKSIIATDKNAVERFSRTKRGRNVIYWPLKSKRNGLLDVEDLVKRAYEFGMQSLLIEGGSRVATSFLKAGLVNKYVAFIAPRLLGQGINVIGDMENRNIDEALSFKSYQLAPCGKDFVFTGYPEQV